MSSPRTAVFVGSDSLLLQCLAHWQSLGHRVLAVATDAAKVRAYCHQHGLRCLDARQDWVSLVGERPEFLFAVTWLQLLPEAALLLPHRAAINFHDGPLPKHAGLNATCWAILAGDTRYGVTWHHMAKLADAGQVLVQQEFALEPDDTAFALNARCFQAAQESFVVLCERIANDDLQGSSQDLTQRSWHARADRPRDLGVLDLRLDSASVLRVVRALDHGGYRNPLASSKLLAAQGVVLPGQATPVAARGAPGQVLACDGDTVTVACADGAVLFTHCKCVSGTPMHPELWLRYGFRVGATLPELSPQQRVRLQELSARSAAGEPKWVEQLAAHAPLEWAELDAATLAGPAAQVTVELPCDDATELAALVVAFLARRGAAERFTLSVAGLCGAAGSDWSDWASLVCDQLPLTCHCPGSLPVGETRRLIAKLLAAPHAPLLRDVAGRYRDVLSPLVLAPTKVQLRFGACAEDLAPGSVAFCVTPGRVTLCAAAETLPEAVLAPLGQQLLVFARAAEQAPECLLREVPILREEELRQLLAFGRGPVLAMPSELCVHRQIERAARQFGADVAVVDGGQQVCYAELWQRSGQLAGALAALGVQRGDRVGLCVTRGIGMVTAVLAVLRCGAAYVPLDPNYPSQRLQFMASDAQLRLLLVDAGSAARAPQVSSAVWNMDANSALAVAAPQDGAAGEDLAYLIYTSGSTGQPKGVMVRHSNVANFFLGMDQQLGTSRGTWLAVTSLSFDIAVLELLWTLARGFTVVLATADASAQARAVPPVAFSLFYFASDEGEFAADKYRLLTEGARFADAHGFEAVWTPERHFHAFGGLYPNPAVASAAVAAITTRIAIRAGSCVAPLHHPIRIAEDWALVDNLSGGRVGIAFASGWHARDFVLRPENFTARKDVLFSTIKQVQALWRGETQEFAGHDGKLHRIATLPRPVQKELPTWVTIAGNPETYRQAGEAGAFVLTHLLGQSLDELRGKLALYRQAWRQAGHAGQGKVTLMLHTFVADSDAEAHDLVRGPMKAYLRSSIDLVKQAAWSFPAFKNRVDQPGALDQMLGGGISEAEFEALLDFSFERYYRSSGLFGSVADCVLMVGRLAELGVDEIGCLIDYGVPSEQVLAQLPKLLEVKRQCDAQTAASAAAPTRSLPELLTEHRVTHLQCTPSTMAMWLLDPAMLPAVSTLQHVLLGGELLPPSLAQTLHGCGAVLHNMYGPTETTVWSTAKQVQSARVTIGRPLANQTAYVLDAARQLVPLGGIGELWLGGAGVTAGYWQRAELSLQRFVTDPFAAVPEARMYATGDQVRWTSDGELESLGRLDQQVKVRGFRIELGEIEAALVGCPSVQQAVVVARGTGGEATLVAYVVSGQPAATAETLREALRQTLPPHMVPSHFVFLAELPRTPNQKIDRKSLPAPELAAQKLVVAAESDVEARILAIWRRTLGTEAVGVEDNFFDSGGHSILAVAVHRELQREFAVPLQITDLFRFTTVRALAQHLGGGKASAPTAAQLAAERAKQRRNLLRR